jgi:hypothetical protein
VDSYSKVAFVVDGEEQDGVKGKVERGEMRKRKIKE